MVDAVLIGNTTRPTEAATTSGYSPRLSIRCGVGIKLRLYEQLETRVQILAGPPSYGLVV